MRLVFILMWILSVGSVDSGQRAHTVHGVDTMGSVPNVAAVVPQRVTVGEFPIGDLSLGDEDASMVLEGVLGNRREDDPRWGGSDDYRFSPSVVSPSWHCWVCLWGSCAARPSSSFFDPEAGAGPLFCHVERRQCLVPDLADLSPDVWLLQECMLAPQDVATFRAQASSHGWNVALGARDFRGRHQLIVMARADLGHLEQMPLAEVNGLESSIFTVSHAVAEVLEHLYLDGEGPVLWGGDFNCAVSDFQMLPLHGPLLHGDFRLLAPSESDAALSTCDELERRPFHRPVALRLTCQGWDTGMWKYPSIPQVEGPPEYDDPEAQWEDVWARFLPAWQVAVSERDVDGLLCFRNLRRAVPHLLLLSGNGGASLYREGARRWQTVSWPAFIVVFCELIDEVADAPWMSNESAAERRSCVPKAGEASRSASCAWGSDVQRQKLQESYQGADPFLFQEAKPFVHPQTLLSASSPMDTASSQWQPIFQPGGVAAMQVSEVSVEDVSRAWRKMKPRTAPGIDGWRASEYNVGNWPRAFGVVRVRSCC
mmetsp:Transcript_17427/g.44295  ORF Transcript_17427/g.44295 Transcript_17427/m.44295 type:complete len:540 (+) Transcript_17427:2202-3821(+)